MNAGLNGMSSVRRGLLRFDVGSAVPRGAQVRSASLRLVNNSGTISTGVCELRRVYGSGERRGRSGGGNGAPAEMGDALWMRPSRTLAG